MNPTLKLQTTILLLLVQKRERLHAGGRENKVVSLLISGKPFSSRLWLLHPFLCLHLWPPTSVLQTPMAPLFLLFRQIDLALVYDHFTCYLDAQLTHSFLFFICKGVFISRDPSARWKQLWGGACACAHACEFAYCSHLIFELENTKIPQ